MTAPVTQIVQPLTQSAIVSIRQYVPGFDIRSKRDSRFHRWVGKLLALVGNRDYMERFWTTVGYTCYRPEVAGGKNEWQIMWHEGRHAWQAERLTRPLMAFLYLLPLSAVPLLALGCIFSLWWLVPMALCLLPLPAYFRMRMEMEGYTMNMMVDHYVYDALTGNRLVDYLDHFTTSQYYFMWPFRNAMYDRLGQVRADIRSGKVLRHPYCRKLYVWLADNDLLKVR